MLSVVIIFLLFFLAIYLLKYRKTRPYCTGTAKPVIGKVGKSASSPYIVLMNTNI